MVVFRVSRVGVRYTPKPAARHSASGDGESSEDRPLADGRVCVNTAGPPIAAADGAAALQRGPSPLVANDGFGGLSRSAAGSASGKRKHEEAALGSCSPHGQQSQGSFASFSRRASTCSDLRFTSGNFAIDCNLDIPTSFAINVFPDGFNLDRPTERGKSPPLAHRLPARTLYPHDRTSESFLEAIDNGWIPAGMLDDISCHYVDGCVVCEIRDFRHCFPLEGVDARQLLAMEEGPPKVHKVLLRPTTESIIKDVGSLAAEHCSYEDTLELEARILKRVMPPLCLDPSPKVAEQARAFNNKTKLLHAVRKGRRYRSFYTSRRRHALPDPTKEPVIYLSSSVPRQQKAHNESLGDSMEPPNGAATLATSTALKGRAKSYKDPAEGLVEAASSSSPAAHGQAVAVIAAPASPPLAAVAMAAGNTEGARLGMGGGSILGKRERMELQAVAKAEAKRQKQEQARLDKEKKQQEKEQAKQLKELQRKEKLQQLQQAKEEKQKKAQDAIAQREANRATQLPTDIGEMRVLAKSDTKGQLDLKQQMDLKQQQELRQRREEAMRKEAEEAARLEREEQDRREAAERERSEAAEKLFLQQQEEQRLLQPKSDNDHRSEKDRRKEDAANRRKAAQREKAHQKQEAQLAARQRQEQVQNAKAATSVKAGQPSSATLAHAGSSSHLLQGVGRSNSGTLQDTQLNGVGLRRGMSSKTPIIALGSPEASLSGSMSKSGLAGTGVKAEQAVPGSTPMSSKLDDTQQEHIEMSLSVLVQLAEKYNLHKRKQSKEPAPLANPRAPSWQIVRVALANAANDMQEENAGSTSMATSLVGGSINARKTRIMEFRKLESQPGGGMQIVASLKMVLCGRGKDSTVEGAIYPGDEKDDDQGSLRHYAVPTIPNPEAADRFALQFASLLAKEGYEHFSDKIHATPPPKERVIPSPMAHQPSQQSLQQLQSPAAGLRAAQGLPSVSMLGPQGIQAANRVTSLAMKGQGQPGRMLAPGATPARLLGTAVAAAKQRVAAQGRGSLLGGQGRQAAMNGRTGADVPVLQNSQVAAPSHAAVAGVSGGGMASPGLSDRASPGIPAAMLGKGLGR
eukprot:SM000053S17451  [mRNA]  locus=s53:438642:445841:- [translate_table: standard]